MKSFTIDIHPDGSVETNLKGYEGQSPELAAIVEAATGAPAERKWNPKAHAHIVNGKKVTHSH